MEEPGEVKLRRQGVAEVAVAQLAVARRREELAVGSRADTAVGVAALNHKVLDDAMEEGAVEDAFASELEEVVAVDGGLVAELNADDASRSLQTDNGRTGLGFGLRAEGEDAQHKHEQEATKGVEGTARGQPEGEHEGEHGGGHCYDDDHHLVLDSDVGRGAAQNLAYHGAGEGDDAHDGHIGDAGGEALGDGFAHEGLPGLEARGSVAEEVIVGGLLTLDAAIEGAEGEHIDSEHIAHQNTHNGDEVASGERIVELQHKQQEEETDDQGCDEETGKGRQGNDPAREACTLHGGVGGDEGHDDDPEGVQPREVPLKEIAQIDTDEEELHDHAQSGHEGGSHEVCPQFPEEIERNEQEQEANGQGRKSDVHGVQGGEVED